MSRIATFNVNSVRAHIGSITGWLREFSPDVALLQEIKVETRAFPYMEFEDMGYSVKAFGQKSYIGVAILSRMSIEDVACGLPTFPDDPSARYIEAVIGGRLRVINAYMPNGNPAPGEKFDYKLAWMEKFREHLEELLENDEALVIGGDFNVVLKDEWVYDAKAFADDAVMRPESREAMTRILKLGFVDAFQTVHPGEVGYTYWGYRAGGLRRNHGMTLDYFLLNGKAAAMLSDAGIDKSPREAEHASDHAPLWISLSEKRQG
jgi:exodeoxyribonuclease-3